MFKKSPGERNNHVNYPVGITCFENFFTDEELKEIEKNVENTEELCKNRAFLPMTAQQTFSRLSNSVQGRLVRTKFFFGYRYMWTREQLAEPFSHVAGGVRQDVS